MLNRRLFDPETPGNYVMEDAEMEDNAATDVKEARENAEHGYQNSGAVTTGRGAFVGNRATAAERHEFATRRYFHGSSSPIPVGTDVVPGASIGKDNFGMGRNLSVFLSSHIRSGASWGKHGESDRWVHEVVPQGFNEAHPRMTAEFQADKATVTRRWKATHTGFDHEDSDTFKLREEHDSPQVKQGRLF